MDPITRLTVFLIGGLFLLNRVAAVKPAKQQKDGGTTPADRSDGTSEKRMGSGDRGQPGHDAAREACQLPGQHLPVTEAAAAPPAATLEPMPAASPASDLAVLTVTKDRKTGRFVKRAA